MQHVNFKNRTAGAGLKLPRPHPGHIKHCGMIASSPCTLLIKPTADAFDVNECRKTLETGSETAKIEAMSSLLAAVANGEPCSSLIMHVIRFVMPNQKNKFLKKLVLYFFELVPKTDSEGKLLQEMILLWYKLCYVFIMALSALIVMR